MTGSADLLDQADALLRLSASAAGAWIPGYETHLALAGAWLRRGEPEHARDVLAPLLAVARGTPWIPVLAEALLVDGRVLAALDRHAEAHQTAGWKNKSDSTTR